MAFLKYANGQTYERIIERIDTLIIILSLMGKGQYCAIPLLEGALQAAHLAFMGLELD